MAESNVYVYGSPLTKKRLKDDLGLSFEDQITDLKVEEDSVRVEFSVPLTPQQEATLSQLLKPYSRRQKFKEGKPDPPPARPATQAMQTDPSLRG